MAPSATILETPITWQELQSIASAQCADVVKAVVDIDRNLVAIGGRTHADGKAMLLSRGSAERHLWGIQLRPDRPADQRVGFDSMINVRPANGKRSRHVEHPAVRAKILGLIAQFVQD